VCVLGWVEQEVAKLLLAHGADIDAVDDTGLSVLNAATQQRKDSVRRAWGLD
jgi:hypothetical protein